MEMSVKKCYQLLKRDEIEDKFNRGPERLRGICIDKK